MDNNNKRIVYLYELQVCQGSDVEVGGVLWRGAAAAVVELAAAAAAHRQRLAAVRAAQGRRAEGGGGAHAHNHGDADKGLNGLQP